MSRTIFIVDDHPIMRRGYAQLIGSEPDLVMNGEAGSAAEALTALERIRPDLVVIDISLGGANGLELTKQLTALHPGLAILIISMHQEALYAPRALAAGARGYIMKSEADRTTIDAIRHILAGGYYFSEEMTASFLSRLGGGRVATTPSDPLDRLSDRELEIFELLGRGHTSSEIAAALAISPKTVETHRARIKEKLGVSSGRELLLYAVRWVDGEEGDDTSPHSPA